MDEEVGIPYLVVIEAKRGISGTDPMAQLLAAMLCAARLDEREGTPNDEIFGAHPLAPHNHGYICFCCS